MLQANTLQHCCGATQPGMLRILLSCCQMTAGPCCLLMVTGAPSVALHGFMLYMHIRKHHD
jgi:hypothetical protein